MAVDRTRGKFNRTNGLLSVVAILVSTFLWDNHQIKVTPDDIVTLMLFECGGDHLAVNDISGALGMIQFMPSTLKGMGIQEEDKANYFSSYPVAQVPLIVEYLRRNARGRTALDLDDLAAAVFYPAYMGQPDRVFSAKVQEQNPGIRCMRDYTNKMRAAASKYADVLRPATLLADPEFWS